MSIDRKLQQAAAGAGGGLATGKYLAVGHNTSPYFTLLDHTTPGSLSLATTYTLPSVPTFQGSVAWSPDGEYVAVRPNSNTVSVTLLDHSTEGSLSFLDDIDIGNADNGVTFDPRGTYLYAGQSGTTTGYIQIVNYSNPSALTSAGQLYWNLQTPLESNIEVSKDNDYLLYGASASGGLHIADASTLGSLSHVSTYTIAGNTSVKNVRFSSDDSYVAVMNNLSAASYGAVQLFSWSAGTLTFEQMINPLGTNNGYECSWSPDDAYLVVGLNNTINSVILYEHSAGSLSQAATYLTAGGRAWAIDMAPDGQYIAVGGNSSPYLTLLDHTTPGSLSLAATYTLPGYASAVKFSPT